MVIAVMAALTLIGLYLLASNGDWSLVATPFCVGLVSFSSVSLRDITDGRSQRYRPVVIGALSVVAIALAGMAIFLGSDVSVISTSLVLLGALTVVGGYFWQLRHLGTEPDGAN